MNRPGYYWSHLECRWELCPGQTDVVVPEQARDEPETEDLSAVRAPLPAGID